MTTAPARVSTWQIDRGHTVAEFAAKHLMVATVKGRFHDVSGTLHIDQAAPENSWVEARIGTASVDTGIGQRDDHLRSDDFFNAGDYPDITFRSRGAVKVADDTWDISGDLTIRDITREVVLRTELDRRTTGMDGRPRAAFTAETTVNRKDFGLRYNAVVEGGVFVVGDKVKITLHVSAVLDA